MAAGPAVFPALELLKLVLVDGGYRLGSSGSEEIDDNVREASRRGEVFSFLEEAPKLPKLAS